MDTKALLGLAPMLLLPMVSTPVGAPAAPEPVERSTLGVTSAQTASRVAAWDFDEGSGQEAVDASGNGLHATLGLTGSADRHDPAWVPGFRGMALDFDASNDFVDAGAGLNATTSELTITAWIRPDSLGKREVIAKGNAGYPSVGDFGMRIQDAAGRVSARTRTASGWMEVVTVSRVSAGAWTFLAMVADPSGLRIYVNGVRDPAAPGVVAPFNESNANKTYIGAHPAPNLFPYDAPVNTFDGRIDEVRVWHRALSDSEIAESAGGGPVAQWLFDEREGQEVADSSGRGFHGTLGSGPSSDPHDPRWFLLDSGAALLFDGLDDSVKVDGAVGPFASELTVAAWIYLERFLVHPGGNIVSKGSWYPETTSDRVGDFRLFILESDGQSYVYADIRTSGGVLGFRSVGTVPLRAWTHVAMVADASDLRIYISGVQDPRTYGRMFSFDAPNENPVLIGAWPRVVGLVNGPFYGVIDEIGIWNRALSPGEIADMARR